MRMENGHLMPRKNGTCRNNRGKSQNERGTYQR